MTATAPSGVMSIARLYALMHNSGFSPTLGPPLNVTPLAS